jgi:hypothetical protein
MDAFRLAVALALAALVLPARAVDYAKNLAQVPEADPAPTEVPKLLDAVKGQHPRLLFTKAEIEELKKRVASDPILKKAAEDTVAAAKKFKLPDEKPKPGIVLNDTPALATSFDRYAGLAWAYALDRDPAIKDAIVKVLGMMLEQPYWADGNELDSNMGAGNNMFMAALLFDAAYPDLEPAFRAKMAAKLLLHARRLYYLGHLEKCVSSIKYWQQDTQNNHRWHRDAGLAACLLAVADEPGLQAGWMLEQLRKEYDFLMKWLPPDGDCHEGAGYQVFGFIYLAFGAGMMDRNLGTAYLKHPAFTNAWAQHVYYRAPGRQGPITFGDDSNAAESTFGSRDAGFFLCPRLTRDKNAHAALKRNFLARAVSKDEKRPYAYPWTLLAFYDPTLDGGDAKALPTCRLFPDLGAASLRDSWEDDAVCFTFKCGPYGGYMLNEYAWANKDKDGKPHYVNVAHDDPDANSFAVGSAGAFFFHPGTYSWHKMTMTSNTVTVDDKGQAGEGDDFTQPVPGVDMRTLSYLTGWKAGEAGRVIVEGEAGPAYMGFTGPELARKAKQAAAAAAPAAGGEAPPAEGAPPALEKPIVQTTPLKKFRRTAIWMPGDYVLLLDDLAAAKPAKICWRGGAVKAQFDKPEEGWCSSTAKNGKRLEFQVLANKPFSGSIDFVLLAGRWGNELLQQFQFFAETDAIRYACLLDAWKKKPSMTFSGENQAATVTVKGPGYTDTWTWSPAKDLATPSDVSGARDGKPLLALTEKDRAPRGEGP